MEYNIIITDASKYKNNFEDLLDLFIIENDNNNNDYKKSIDFTYAYDSCYKFIETLVINETECDIKKLIITFYLPFIKLETLLDYNKSINLEKYKRIISNKENVMLSKFNSIKIVEYVKKKNSNSTSEGTFILNQKDTSKNGHVDLEFHLISNSFILEQHMLYDNQIYCILPNQFYVSPETLFFCYEKINNEPDTITRFNIIEPKIIYMNKKYDSFINFNLISFIDKIYFLEFMKKHKNINYPYQGFQGSCLIFFKNQKKIHIDSTILFNNNLFDTKLSKTNNSKKDNNPLLNKMIKIHPDHIEILNKHFEPFPSYIPEYFINEKFTNISYWYFQHLLLSDGKNNFLSNQLWTIIKSFYLIFLFYVIYCRASAIQIFIIYLLYFLIIIFPQILKKDLIFPNRISANKNITVRPFLDGKVNIIFDWTFGLTYYLFPLNRIMLSIISIFVLLNYIFHYKIKN